MGLLLTFVFFQGKKWIVSFFTHKEQKEFQCTELCSLLTFLCSKNFNTIAGRRKVRFNFSSNKKNKFRLPTQVYKCSERAKAKGKYSSLGHAFSYCWLGEQGGRVWLSERKGHFNVASRSFESICVPYKKVVLLTAWWLTNAVTKFQLQKLSCLSCGILLSPEVMERCLQN